MPEELSLTILMRLIRIQLCFSRVDLDFVYKQLLDGYKPCNTTLFLTQYQRERFIGLTSILYLSLQNYSTVSMVKHDGLFWPVLLLVNLAMSVIIKR